MKRIFAAMLAVLMLLLCGCSTILPDNGTLSLDANNVDHIKITNGLTGNTFSTAERETINTIVNYLNSFTLENGTEAGAEYHYTVTLVSTNGGAESYYSVINDDRIISGGFIYSVNAKDFRHYLEEQECNTMTDNELIDALLEGNTLEQLNIVDDEGKISVDKIINLPKSCPALFELLSRPSAIPSVGSYGVDKLGSFLNSTNPELVEKGQEWIEVLKKLIPDIQEKLENLMKNQKNSENNP